MIDKFNTILFLLSILLKFYLVQILSGRDKPSAIVDFFSDFLGDFFGDFFSDFFWRLF